MVLLDVCSWRRICKLFRFADGQWKERGTGEVKILKHKSTGIHRVIMREGGTKYVRANHLVDPSNGLLIPDGDDTGKRFRFQAMDFADDTPVAQVFLIFFRSAEFANEFKAAHDAARRGNLVALSAAATAGASAGASASAAPAPAAAADADTSGTVPDVDDISEAWGESDDDAKRIDSLTAAFTEAFGSEPDFFVHAPGRVNVIGEHVDYHLFSVLPFALRQDIVFAVSSSDDAASGVQLRNTNDKFAAITVPADPAAGMEGDKGAWHRYFLAGFKAAFASMPEGTAPRGLRVLVDGRVPPGGGVSSSSAMSVGSCLATVRAHGATITRSALATAAQKAEAEAVGTMSGGMDQAICAMGNRGEAVRVDFAPLKATPVSLPAEAAFVVANSLVESAKAVNPEERYNMRVTEGLFGVKLVAKKAGVDAWKAVNDARSLVGALGLDGPGALAAAVEEHLAEGGYTLAELEAAFGEDAASVMAECDRKAKVLEVTAAVPDAKYELRKRLRHVATEAQRVLDFEAACAGEHTADSMPALGRLMDDSHASCRDDYECSCDELDALVAVAKEAGALGARLTGAGWGGCIVALVPKGKEDDVIAAMDAKYYAAKEGQDTKAARFASTPAAGAAIFTPAGEL